MMSCRSSFIPHPKGSNECSRYSRIAHVVELFLVCVNPPSEVLALGPDGYAGSVEAASREPAERVRVGVCVLGPDGYAGSVEAASYPELCVLGFACVLPFLVKKNELLKYVVMKCTHARSRVRCGFILVGVRLVMFT